MASKSFPFTYISKLTSDKLSLDCGCWCPKVFSSEEFVIIITASVFILSYYRLKQKQNEGSTC